MGHHDALTSYSAKKCAVKEGDCCSLHFLLGRFSKPQTGGTTHSRKRAGQSPKNFPTNKIFLPKIPGLGAEIFHPFNSLRPAQLNRFPEKIPKKTAGFRGRKILWVGRFSKPQTGGPNNSEHALRFLPVVTKTCFGGWAPKNRRIQSGNRTSGYA